MGDIQYPSKASRNHKVFMFMFLAALMTFSACKNTINGPRKTVGDWYHAISRNMGGFYISQTTKLTITRNGPGDYNYMVAATVVDEMYSNEPKIIHSQGKLEDTAYDNKWSFVGGDYGHRNAYIIIPPGEWEYETPTELNIDFGSGRGNLMVFHR